jgi:hypothetical protein
LENLYNIEKTVIIIIIISRGTPRKNPPGTLERKTKAIKIIPEIRLKD